MGIAVFTFVAFLALLIVSGRAWWQVSSGRFRALFICSVLWAIVVTDALPVNQAPVLTYLVLVVLAFGPVAWVRSARAAWPGTRASAARQGEQAKEEGSMTSPEDREREALLRALGKDQEDLGRKKPISAATAADREKDALLRDIARERLELLAKKARQ